MTRVFLDACLVIDLVEGTAEQQQCLKAQLRGRRVYGSELVRMEARLQAIRDNRLEHLETYDRYFADCWLVPFDRSVFDLATRLRIAHRIKTPDTLHLAAALIAECDQFWTNDQHLAKAAEGHLEIVDWERLSAEPLPEDENN